MKADKQYQEDDDLDELEGVVLIKNYDKYSTRDRKVQKRQGHAKEFYD